MRGTLSHSHLEALRLTTWPDFYLEGTLERNEAATQAVADLAARARAAANKDEEKPPPAPVVVVLRPRVLHYAATAAKRSRSDRKTLGIVLVFAQNAIDPVKDGTGDKALASIPLLSERMRIGTEARAEDEGATALADLAAAVALPASAKDQPLNIYALVTETENASALQKQLLVGLKGKEDELGKTLAEALKKLLGGEEKEEAAGGAGGG
jgi:hypothetical protein